MTTSAANPQELRDYVSQTSGSREDADAARDLLVAAYEAFVAAVPAGFDVPARPNVAGPLGRGRDVDAYATTVATRFEEAGSVTDGGVYTMDSALLASIPYASRYSEQQRQELRQRAEEELAQLREVMRDGTSESTVGELVSVLGWMRYEIDRAPTPEARQQAARDLIDTMGAADLHEALAILETEARGLDDLDESSQPVVAIADLAYVVSLGLEGNPDRAQSWAQELADRRGLPADVNDLTLGSDEADGLALLGYYTADGTQEFGVALFDQLWDAPSISEDGLTSRLLGATSPIHPTLMNAAENPTLAYGLVDHLLETPDPWSRTDDGSGPDPRTRFDTLFAEPPTEGGSNPIWDREEEPGPRPFPDVPRDLLGDVLTSSVDPSLDDADRIDAAARITTHYVEYQDHFTYSEPVTRGLASATQPLLEAWEPVAGDENGRLLLPGYSSEEVSQVNQDLWRAIGQYGENEGGVEGLATSLSGATTHHLSEAVTTADMAGDTYPFDPDGLNRLNRLYSTTAATVSSTRFTEVVAALEDSGVDWDMVHVSAMADVMGGAAGPAGGVVEAAAGYLEAASQGEAPEITSHTANPFYNIETLLDTQLIDMTLGSDPGLEAALGDQLRETAREGGPGAVVELVLDPPAGSDPELLRLRDLVNDQIAAVDLADAQDIFQASNPLPEDDD